MQGLEVLPKAFVTVLQSAIIAEPAERAFDDVASLAQATAMFALAPTVGSQKRSNAPLNHLVNEPADPIRSVPLQYLGFASWSSASSSHGGNLIEQRQSALGVGLIGRPGFNRQRHSPGIGDYVPFAPFFRAVGGIGAGVSPPKTARTDALSTTARESRSEPRFPKRRNSRRCNSGQTFAWVHCRSRRQQVTPLPQPISAGSMFQGKPLLRMKIIPIRQARSETAGRPPLADAVCWGNKGSISVHRHLGSNADICSPPCGKRRRNTSNLVQVLK